MGRVSVFAGRRGGLAAVPIQGKSLLPQPWRDMGKKVLILCLLRRFPSIYTRFPPIPSHGVGARSADIAAKLNKSGEGGKVEKS